MHTRVFTLFAVICCLMLLPIAAFAQGPVKWSAPMQTYPRSWTPTQAPPQYAYPQQYMNPNYYGYYGGYGYGPYAHSTAPGPQQPTHGYGASHGYPGYGTGYGTAPWQVSPMPWPFAQ